MVISCFYNSIQAAVKEKGITLDEAMKIAKESGIDAVDITPTMFSTTSELEEFFSLIKKYNISVSSVFLGEYCRMGTEADYTKSLAKMKDGINFAKRAGSKYFMAVPLIPLDAPDFENELYRKEFRRLFANMVKYGIEVGVQVTVEDYSETKIPYSSYEDIDWLLDNIPELRFTYDSGNFPLVEIDELESVKRYADKTVHVHLKDLLVVDHETDILRNGKFYDSLELGGGYLKNEEALLHLKEKGYNGAVVIEVSAAKDAFARTIKSAEYLRRILNA